MNKTVIFLDPKGTIFEIIRAAKKRGFYVIALSSDPSLLDVAEPYRSARHMVDEVKFIDDWNNDLIVSEIIESILNRVQVVGVYGGMDACAFHVAWLREKLGLPTSKPESVKNVLNKFLMRSTLKKNGLSDLKIAGQQEMVKNLEKNWLFDKAAYFKPTHGAFSAFVARCESQAQFKELYQKWLLLADSKIPNYLKRYLERGEFYLEEEIEGELLSVEAIASGNKLQVLGLLSRILFSKNHVVEMGSCFPYHHPQIKEIIDLVTKSHLALGLTDGPTHTEVIVGKNGKLEIIDLNPRFVGADVLQSINYAFNFNIEEVLLDFSLGLKISLPEQIYQYCCLQYFLPPKISTFESIKFPDAPEIKFKSVFKKPGYNISSNDQQIDYLGCYLTVASSVDEAKKKSELFKNGVLVNECEKGVY